MNKSFLKNKTFRRVISFVAAAVVTISGFTHIPQLVRAAWPTSDVTKYTATINGNPITSVTTVHDGDVFKVNVEWTLANGDKTEGGVENYTNIIKLSPNSNISIPQFSNVDLLFGSRVVGKASIQDDGEGNLVMVLDLRKDLDDKFLSGENDRIVNGVIQGVINTNGEAADGDDITIEAGDVLASTSVKFDNGSPESSLWVYKSAGELTWDSVSSKWVQHYTVSVGTTNGAVKDIKLTDTPGSYLSNVSNFKVESANGATKSDDTAITTGATFTGGFADSDLDKFKLAAGGSISFSYDMEVSGAIFNENASYSESQNTISGTYKTNKNNDKSPIPSTAAVSVAKPSYSKTLAPGATDGEQKWTITIKAGDIVKKNASINLSDVISKIEDPTPDGLQWVSPATNVFGVSGLTLSTGSDGPFTETYTGSGVWTYTYTTKIDPAGALASAESTDVTNKATITPVTGSPVDRTATYRTQGQPGGYLVKDWVSIDESGTDPILTWKVTLNNLKNTYKNVVVTDNDWGNVNYSSPGGLKSWGAHTVDTEAITISYKKADGTVVTDAPFISSILSGTVDSTAMHIAAIDTGSRTIKFNDEFITGKDSGDNPIATDKYADLTTPIVLTFKSKITDTDLRNKVYYNKAKFTYENNGITLGNADDATYEKTVFPVNAMKKTGVADDDADTILYTLDVDMYELAAIIAANGDKNLVLTDTLPEGLTYDTSYTPTIDDVFRWGVYDTADTKVSVLTSDFYIPSKNRYDMSWTGEPDKKAISEYAISSMNPTYTDSTRKLALTIPLKASDVEVVNGYMRLKNCVSHNLKITFRAKIDPSYLATFSTKTSTQNFENKANGTYGDNAVNASDAIAVNSLNPPKIISKDGEAGMMDVDGRMLNAAKYEIDINPNAVDMDASDWLVGEDELGAQLSYYLDSIKLYEVPVGGTIVDGTPLTMGTDYTWKYDMSSNKLTFKLPDGKHLILQYYALMNVYNGTQTGQLTTGVLDPISGGKNTFKLLASKIDTGNFSDAKSFSLAAVTHDYWVTSAVGEITIQKYAMVDDMPVPVKGTVFELYRSTSANNEIPAKDAMPVGTYTVSSDGTLNITGLTFNQVYILVEKAPGVYVDSHGVTTPMKVRTEDYAFIVPGTADMGGAVHSSVHLIASGNTQYYENEVDGETPDKTITISKKAVGSAEELAGATLSLRKVEDCDINGELLSTSSEVGHWTSGTVAKSITVTAATEDFANGKIKAGEYWLVETGAPDGYAYTEAIKFSVDVDGNITSTTVGAASGSTLTMRDAGFNVYVDKHANEDGTKLAGAALELYVWDNTTKAVTGTALESWTSSATSPHLITTKLKVSDPSNTYYYAVKETSNPTGYEYFKNGVQNVVYTVFTVDKDGKIAVVESYDDTTSTALQFIGTGVSTKTADSATVIINNKKQDAVKTFNISKKAISGTDELAGAELSLYDGAGYTNLVGTWTSGTDAKTFTIDSTTNFAGAILAAGDYKLVETGAPNGYAYAEDITFTLNADGKFTATGVEGTGTNTLTMRDTAFGLYIDKQDINGGAEVSGATLTLYEGTTLSSVVHTWVSGTEAVKIPTSKLKANQEYTLVETGVPGAYEKIALYTYFEIGKDGKVTNVSSYNSLSDLSTHNGTGAVAGAASKGTYDSGSKTVKTAGSTDDGLILNNRIKDKIIKISKQAIGGSTELPGATLVLRLASECDASGNRISGTDDYTWKSGTTPLDVYVTTTTSLWSGTTKKIYADTYWLVEKGAPNGYAYSEAIKFTVDPNGVITDVSGDANAQLSGTSTLIMRDGVNALSILKADSTDGNSVEGATLYLKDVTVSADIATWNTTSAPKAIPQSALIAEHEYELVETIVPGAYEPMFKKVVFKLGKDGKIDTTTLKYVNMSDASISYSTSDNTIKLSADKGILLVNNKPKTSTIAISKKAIAGSAELPGATLTLKKVVAPGNVVDVGSWVSGTTSKEILITATPAVMYNSDGSIKSIPEGTYILEETAAPAGYLRYTEAAQFDVRIDGEISNVKKYPDGSSVENPVVTVSGSKNVLTLRNDVVKLYIDKQTIQNGAEVEGAKLVLKDSFGTVVDTWTSSATAPHRIPATSIRLNETYTLTEEVVPAHYSRLASVVSFKLLENGKVESGSLTYTLEPGVNSSTVGAFKSTYNGGDMVVLNNYLITDPKPTPTSDEEDVDPEPSGAKVLPDTGGVVGSVALMLLALAMLISGAVLLMPEKKRKRE